MELSESVSDMFQDRMDFFQYIPLKEHQEQRKNYRIQLRKEQRKGAIKAKRALYSNKHIPRATDCPPLLLNCPETQAYLKELLSPLPSSKFRACFQILSSPLSTEVLQDTVEYLRNLLSSALPATKEFLEIGLLDLLLEQGRQPTLPQKTLVDICWILSNIASHECEECSQIIEKDGLYFLVKALDTLPIEQCEYPLWALANLAGDCSETRELMLEIGVLGRLAQLTEDWGAVDLSLLKVVAWFCNSLTLSAPEFTPTHVSQLLTLIPPALRADDIEAFTDSLWACANLGKTDQFVGKLVEIEVMQFVSKAIRGPHEPTKEPAISVIGNLCSGAPQYTQYSLNAGSIELLELLVHHKNPVIRKKVAWTSSNIAAGTYPQILLLTSHKLWTELVGLLLDTDVRVCLEAGFILSNFVKRCVAYPREICRLTTHFETLAKTIKMQSLPDLLIMLLDVCYHTLLAARELTDPEKTSVFKAFEETGCKEALERIQDHANLDIADLSNELICEFFEKEA